MGSTLNNKRPKKNEIRPGSIYACKHEEFSFKLEVEVLKLYVNSALCKIIKCDPVDERTAKDHLWQTVVNTKNIWWTIKNPPVAPDEIVEVTVTNPRKVGDKTKIRPVLVHFEDGRVKRFKTARDVDVALGYKKGFVYRTLNRYQLTKRHGLVFVEYEENDRTEPLDFENNRLQKGAIHLFVENGTVLFEGTIAELARKTGYSKHMINWFKYHGTNKKVVLKN